MENLLTRLEEILAGWLGGAVIAQTVSKLLLMGVTALAFGALRMAVGRLSRYLERKSDEWCGTRLRIVKNVEVSIPGAAAVRDGGLN